MTNKEKYNEVFKETFGYTPEDCFPCPEKCPEGFVDSCCDACPYARFANKEYKKPEKKLERNYSELRMKETFYIGGFLRNYKSDGMPRKNAKRFLLHICHSKEEVRKRLEFDCDFNKYDIHIYDGKWNELSILEFNKP